MWRMKQDVESDVGGRVDDDVDNDDDEPPSGKNPHGSEVERIHNSAKHNETHGSEVEIIHNSAKHNETH